MRVGDIESSDDLVWMTADSDVVCLCIGAFSAVGAMEELT